MTFTRTSLGLLAAVTATTVFAAPAVASPSAPAAAPAPAPAQSGPVVGPGSPIRVPVEGAEKDENNRYLESGMCSLGVPGTLTDPETGESKEVILTAGHCIVQTDDGAEFGMPKMEDTAYVPTADGDVPLGVVDVASFDLSGESEHGYADANYNANDYAILELAPGVTPTSLSDSRDEFGRSHGEPVQITGIRDYKALERGEVSVDNFGEPICTDGARTGRQCGYQIFRAKNGVWTVVIRLGKGDSGGSAFNPETGEFIGVNSMAVGPFNRIQPADAALEEAYGIPDGQVNDYFTPTENTAEHSDTRTMGDDTRYQLGKAVVEPALEQAGANARDKAYEYLPEQVADAAVDVADKSYAATQDALGLNGGDGSSVVGDAMDALGISAIPGP
ncbi:trypsin-like serine protease [Corynebacterium sp. 335C]